MMESPNTSTNPSSIANFDHLGGLLTIHRQLHDSFVSTFKGVPLRVDESLSGNAFYCAVSPEIFEEIKKKYGAKMA